MTKLWSWFTSIFKSVWFKAFLMLATEKLKKILEQVGQEAYDKIRVKIIEISKSNLSNTEKAKAVAKYIKELVPVLADSAINYLLESMIQDLKSKKVI